MQQQFVVLSLFFFSIPTWGEVGSTATAAAGKKIPKIKMEYEVTSDRAHNEVEVVDSVQWQPQMNKWMSENLLPKFRKMPTVASIQLIEGKVETDHAYKNYDWADYVPHKRNSHMLVQFKFSTPITLLFKVVEEKKECKAVTTTTTADDDGDDSWVTPTAGDTAPCNLETSISITGPKAIYGTFASSLNTGMLFRDQISVEWKMSTDYSKKNTELEGTFSTSSPNFQQALLKILDYAKFKPVFAQQFAQNPVRPTLKQAVRVIRSVNEEILRGE